MLTDSGGVQQGAYIHKRPCVTLRENTEWLGTLTNNCNRLSGALDIERISEAIHGAYTQKLDSWPDIFGDGEASKRIVDGMLEFMNRP